jgi:hypothetical protein
MTGGPRDLRRPNFGSGVLPPRALRRAVGLPWLCAACEAFVRVGRTVTSRAMGCASWRSHQRLREHAALAPLGGTIRVGADPVRGTTSVLGLNEVGVTDLVMATIWRFGPRAAAYAVSPTAEANHLGADIAIIHPGTSRLLLYQAKLAHLQGDTSLLKSAVSISQMRLLNRRRVTLDGSVYRISGRRALYQADRTPFLHRCPNVRLLDRPEWWHGLRDSEQVQPAPEMGRRYYQEILVGCGCSPSGILASSVPRLRTPLSSIPATATWPWEFDTHEWLRGASPLDGLGDWSERQADTQVGPPGFEPYHPTPGDTSPEVASRMATQLAQQLRLPESHRMYVVVVG